MRYFDKEKFTFTGISGVTQTKIYKDVTRGPFWNRRVEKIHLRTEKGSDFKYNAAYDGIPKKEDCYKYREKFTGTFPLVSSHYYTCEEKYSQRNPLAYVLLSFEELSAVEIPAICIEYKIDTDVDIPMADISFHVFEDGTQGWIEVVLRFASQEQIQRYTTCLEPGESIVIAKLKK